MYFFPDSDCVRIVSLYFFNRFSFDELFQSLVDVYNDPDFDPDLSSIWDFTAVEDLQKINADEINKIVSYVSWKRSAHSKIRTAIVVSKKIDFGLARMYEQEMEAASQNEINVFRDLNSALEWLK